MVKKSKYRQDVEDVKLLISEAKIKNNMDDMKLAKKMGISRSTLRNKKSDPGRFRLEDIWVMEELAGRPLRGLEKLEA